VLACRLSSLRGRTEAATADQAFLASVRARLTKADAVVDEAQTTCEEGRRQAARRALQRLGRQVVKFMKLVDSRAGRRAVPEDGARNVLLGQAGTMRNLVKDVRRNGECPPS
jgi:hypothetical protein